MMFSLTPSFIDPKIVTLSLRWNIQIVVLCTLFPSYGPSVFFFKKEISQVVISTGIVSAVPDLYCVLQTTRRVQQLGHVGPYIEFSNPFGLQNGSI